MGGRSKREGIYVYLWLIHTSFDRKQQKSVKQFSFNKKTFKKNKKKKKKKQELAGLEKFSACSVVKADKIKKYTALGKKKEPKDIAG